MKFACAYIEEEVRDTPRVKAILSRLSDTPIVDIGRYGEVFNRNAQNFRLQKQNPALILAKKHGNLVLPSPADYGFNENPSFYFSHMLNCVYDCRYCFLQGMYRSANYVLFTNYEDFASEIDRTASDKTGAVFYSGYDCDSLALEPVSGFIDYFVPWFSRHTDTTLELRTKSTQVRKLQKFEPLDNCVIAMSFTPEPDHRRWELRVPAIAKRLDALARLQRQGWQIALRFEPLIYSDRFREHYQTLFAGVFSKLNTTDLHSVSIGQFRMPKNFYSRVASLYPDEALFARKFQLQDGQVVQLQVQQEELRQGVEELLFRYIDKSKYYHCG